MKKMNSFKKEILQSVRVLILALVLVMGIGVVHGAWTPPPAGDPPVCTDMSIPGCNPPINISGVAQSKVGGLIVSSGTPAPGAPGLFVVNGRVAINNYLNDTGNDNIKLDVGGQVRIRGGATASDGLISNGQVLTAIGTSGVAEWRDLPQAQSGLNMKPYGTGSNQTTGVGATVSFAFGYSEAYGQEPGHNIGVTGGKWATSWAGTVTGGTGPALPGGSSAKWMVNMVRMDQIGDSAADREMYTSIPYVSLTVVNGGTSIGSILGVPPTDCTTTGNDYDCGETRNGWAVRIQ